MTLTKAISASIIILITGSFVRAEDDALLTRDQWKQKLDDRREELKQRRDKLRREFMANNPELRRDPQVQDRAKGGVPARFEERFRTE